MLFLFEVSQKELLKKDADFWRHFFRRWAATCSSELKPLPQRSPNCFLHVYVEINLSITCKFACFFLRLKRQTLTEWIKSGNTCPRPYLSLPLPWVWGLLSYFQDPSQSLIQGRNLIFLPESVLLPSTRIKAKTSKKIVLRGSKKINWTMSQRQMVKTLPGRRILCVGPNASILSNHSALQN